MPSTSGSATVTVHLEELDADTISTVEERTTEIVTFTDEKMGALHRFLGRVMPTPEAGFASTAPELIRQLHEMIGDRVDSVVRDRFLRHNFDPDLS